MDGQNEYVFKPDGIHECEIKMFTLVQKLRNVTIEIIEDQEGNVSIGWYRQEDTEDITGEEDPDELYQ